MAGGTSSRFGRDKALVELGGRPMYARIGALFKSVVLWKTRLVGNVLKYDGLGMVCIPDLWPGEGPLGGIVTALRHTSATDEADYNLIVSCDMPFLTKEWIGFLLERAFDSEAQVVLPRSTHGLEPLCAVWRTDTCGAVEDQFRKGVRRVTEAISNLKSEVLDERDWKRFDSDGRLFWNMNTLADYEEARRIVEMKDAALGPDFLRPKRWLRG